MINGRRPTAAQDSDRHGLPSLQRNVFADTHRNLGRSIQAREMCLLAAIHGRQEDQDGSNQDSSWSSQADALMASEDAIVIGFTVQTRAAIQNLGDELMNNRGRGAYSLRAGW